jgi:flavin-dependent dehydrogenase
MSARANRLHGDHAVVIGSGISGLLAARVLSEHFARVSIIERDLLVDEAAPRKGVPQGRHVHILLRRGQSILEHFFPGLFAQMGPRKSVLVDLGHEMRWWRMGLTNTRAKSGVLSQFQTRPLLEWYVRQRVRELANVSFIERSEICGLCLDDSGKVVTGVQLRSAADKTQPASVLTADLVVDASGRASHLPQWLQAHDYPQPATSQVEIDFAYASRIYRRPTHVAHDWKVLICYPNPPFSKRGSYVFPIEDDCWIVTHGSRLGDRPPSDEAGFLEFARSLTHPDVYEAIREAEPVTSITTFRFPSNQRRHYERLRRFPDCLIVLGDAVSSVNPIYGQGMTVCAIEAQALDRCLRAHALTRAARKFRAAVGRIVELPWMLVTCEDFRYPQTIGSRPPGVRFINWYTRKVHELTVTDAGALLTLLGVMQMEQHPMSLYRPGIALKVLAAALRGFLSRGRAPDIAPQSLSHDTESSS